MTFNQTNKISKFYDLVQMVVCVSSQTSFV